MTCGDSESFGNVLVDEADSMLLPVVSFLLLLLLRLSLRYQYAIDAPRLKPVHMSLRRSLLRPRLPSVGRPFTQASPIRSQSTHAPFTYRLGASSSGKGSPVAPPSDNNVFPQSLLDRDDPYFASMDKFSGEDAFFMAKIARSDRFVVFGLADGVGGWRDSGIDPGRYSHGLCRYMAQKTHRPETEGDLKPRNLLQYGYEKVMSDRSIQAGGCTACIGAIEPSGALEVAK